MTRKTIPLTLATVGAALVFAVPAGAGGSMIPECRESPGLCQPASSKPDVHRKQNVRLKAQPRVNTDGTWQAGNHVMK
jgi:hypothetical protein